MKMLKFVIPEGTVTFYDVMHADGSLGAEVKVHPGALVEYAKVKDAEGYINRGQAVVVQSMAVMEEKDQ